jgi:hypothetical protein
LREEHKVRVFENRMLRKMSCRTRDEVTGDWRRLHNKELYALYSTKYYSGNQIKNIEMGGACGTYGKPKRCIQGFGGET